MKLFTNEMTKKKKRIFDIFDEFLQDFESTFKSSAPMGSGYSIQVTYDEFGRPVVEVETYGEVDKEALRKEIESRYPGAKIKGLEKKPLIEEVNEEEEET